MLVGRDAQGRRFDSLVAHADEPWRMLAVYVIGQALDDISPRGGPPASHAEALEWAQDAREWIEGAPALMPSYLACTLARISPEMLRSEAEARSALRWPAVTTQEYVQLELPLVWDRAEMAVAA